MSTFGRGLENKWTVIVHDFSFARDFRSIKWAPTLGYNLWRAGCAGLVLGTVMFFFPRSGADRAVALAAPLIWPLSYVIFLLPLGLLLYFFAQYSPWVSFAAVFIAVIAVTLGDPLVCILKRFLPRLVPVEAPPLLSAQIIIFVLDAPEITIVS